MNGIRSARRHSLSATLDAYLASRGLPAKAPSACNLAPPASV